MLPPKKAFLEPGVIVHTYNPITWDAKAGGLRVGNQAGLHSETLSQKRKKRKEKRKKLLV
jgi:hypothetical protein